MVTLKIVLEALQEGKAFSTELLAQKIGETPEAVQSALYILEQMGKVNKVYMNLHCGGDCKGCISHCSGKDIKAAVRWELAVYGEKTAKKDLRDGKLNSGNQSNRQ